jgi:Asp-tRNA(Asn)/Glu-tRNA(Gln) amidotransferase A subunit family amidase
VPCLSLPWGKGPNGLPLAIQLVGAAGRDGELLRFGAWVERHLT